MGKEKPDCLDIKTEEDAPDQIVSQGHLWHVSSTFFAASAKLPDFLKIILHCEFST